MKHSDRHKRNLIIIGLCAVVMIMAVGFAVFSQQLQINSTSEVTSSWDIEITDIQSANPDGGDAYDVTPPTYTPTTASFSTGLITPYESFRVYQVEVSNLGSLTGEVSIASLSCGNNDAIGCYVADIKDNPIDEHGNWNEESYSARYLEIDEGENDFSNIVFKLKPNEKHYIMIQVWYEDVVSQPVNTTANITLTLNYVQAAAGVPYTGTVYRFIDDNSNNLVDFPDWQNNVTDISDYRMGTDYTNSTPNDDYYFKYTVTNNIVTESYVCFVMDTERCLKGGVDECQRTEWCEVGTYEGEPYNSCTNGYYKHFISQSECEDDITGRISNGYIQPGDLTCESQLGKFGICTYSGTPTVFNANKSLIEEKKSWFEEQGYCSIDSNSIMCRGANIGYDRLHAYADSDGFVHAGIHWNCYVTQDGITNCGGG